MSAHSGMMLFGHDRATYYVVEHGGGTRDAVLAKAINTVAWRDDLKPGDVVPVALALPPMEWIMRL
jgi:hypothetical protein